MCERDWKTAFEKGKKKGCLKQEFSPAEGTTVKAQGITSLKFPIFCKTYCITTCKLKMFMIYTNVKTLFHSCVFPGHY